MRDTWYAGLGHTARMPDYWELLSPDRGPIGREEYLRRHRSLKDHPVGCLQYRARRSMPRLSADARRIQDYILFAYMQGGMTGMMSSAANVDADIRGGQVGAEFRPAQHWKLGGMLAYASGENRASGDALPQMPPLAAV
jgi:iron complex outermembrane receptor protein